MAVGGDLAGAEGVSEGGVVAQDGNLRLRLMRDTDEDYAQVVAWRNTPHVRHWWDPDDPDIAMHQAVSEHRPSILGEDPSLMCFIEEHERPVGFVQFYPWSAYPEELAATGLTVPAGAWSLDLYVGEEDALGRGIGSSVVRMVCDYLFEHEGATAVAFGVDRDNARARRSYEKAGMTPTVEYLDTDTRNFERSMAVLMVRMADGSAP